MGNMGDRDVSKNALYLNSILQDGRTNTKRSGFEPFLKLTGNRMDLKKRRKNKIAIVKPSVSSIYELNIIRGIESKVMDTESNIEIFTAKNNMEQTIAILEYIARGRKADAVITINVKPEPNLINMFKKARIPIVMIDGGPSDQVSSINLDNFKSGYKAVEYLISRGKKSIIVTAGDPRYGYSQEMRVSGSRKAFEEYGIEPGRYDILDYFQYSREDGIDAFEELISRRTDGIFCANGDHFAMGLIEAAREMNVDVPGQLSIVGHDDCDISEAMGITTIQQPITRMGEKATEIILGTLSGENKSVNSFVYDPELIIRRTA